MREIVLGSSSFIRRQLIEQLLIPFQTDSPDIDETPIPGETAAHLAQRLAKEKTDVVAKRHPGAIIIGCDQVSTFQGQIFNKPLTVQNAHQMLMTFSGKVVLFLVGICVFDGKSGEYQEALSQTEVHFRSLSGEKIRRYLSLEQPLDCCGSLQIERLGISLCEKVMSDDPTTLPGLPLITLINMLAQCGVSLY
ncbi:MAG: septum formation protein Maf [Gammaproteobacteria bacterium]|jgi:septum formation protein|nr:septum formation protein Maf [Gammaproteobacteria bacterium]